MIRSGLTFLFATLMAVSGAASGNSPPEEPHGYRLENYRAPVPATLQGAVVLDSAGALQLWSQKTAVFIDTLPRPPKPAGLPRGTIWRDAPRADIPGSIWLPDTGYGELAEPTLRYFENGLAQATKNDKSRPLVFYCLKDCWMSWNAAKRALAVGYANIYWYPDGTDGWAATGQILEPRQPEPRVESQ
jgi:PQQ-dependent catabolism-associated CXXCW motif protein